VRLDDKMLKEFEEYLKTQDFTENTIKSYTKDVELFMRWYIDTTGQEFLPENLTEFDLVEYKSYLLRQNLRPQTKYSKSKYYIAKKICAFSTGQRIA